MVRGVTGNAKEDALAKGKAIIAKLRALHISYVSVVLRCSFFFFLFFRYKPPPIDSYRSVSTHLHINCPSHAAT